MILRWPSFAWAFNHIWHVCALTLRMDVLLDVWELKHPWTDVYLYLSKRQKNIVPYLFSTISQITNPLQGVFTICLTPSILDLDKKKKCRDASWNQVNAATPTTTLFTSKTPPPLRLTLPIFAEQLRHPQSPRVLRLPSNNRSWVLVHRPYGWACSACSHRCDQLGGAEAGGKYIF